MMLRTLLPSAPPSACPSVLLVVATADRTGVETVVMQLAKGLTRRGVQVTVLTFSDGPLRADLDAEGIPHTWIPVRGKSDLRGLRALHRYIRSQAFDVVHTHGARAMFFGNLAAKAAKTSAIFTTFHEFRDTKAHETILFKTYAKIETLLAHHATNFCVAISEAVREDMIGTRRISPAKTLAIPNGIELTGFPATLDSDQIRDFRQAYHLSAEDFVVGSAGRLTHVKGHVHLIEAMAAFKPRANVKLLIAGEGPLRHELEQRVAQLGLTKNIHFTGRLANLSVFYHSLDLFVLPSLIESFGLVLLEALACGRPVIATHTGGSNEILERLNAGMRVASGDREALATAIQDVMNDPPPAHARMATRARLEAEYSLDSMIDRHLALYAGRLPNSPLLPPAIGAPITVEIEQ
ncbi:putative glycosyltransferase EpsF [compost metagenome]